MEKKDVKEAVKLAEKELKEKQIEKVKQLVLKTLEKLEERLKVKKTLEEEIRILRMDVDDLKAGRLDRIEERQAKDEKAKKVSVAQIIKEKVVEHHHYHNDYWYNPYRIVWNVPVYPSNTIYCCDITQSSSVAELGRDDIVSFTNNSSSNGISINCSLAKDYTVGTYEIGEKVIHLR